MNVYPFIDAEKKSTSDGQRGGNVKRSCELLGVSRSAYYADAATQAAGGSARARQDAVLTGKIIQLHDDSNGTYGSPRVHADLIEAGLQHGRKRVARLMREAGVYGKTRRRFVGSWTSKIRSLGSLEGCSSCRATARRSHALAARSPRSSQRLREQIAVLSEQLVATRRDGTCRPAATRQTRAVRLRSDHARSQQVTRRAC